MRTKRYRRGISLIELAVVIALGATLISLAIVTFTKVLTMRASAHEHLERTTQTARLAEQFRRDVWNAKSASKTERDKVTLHATENRRLEYEIVDGSVRRTETKDDKIIHVAIFELPGASALQFTMDELKGHPRLSIVLASLKPHPVEGEDPYGKRSRITAYVGRDHRTAQGSQEGANE